MLVLKQGHDSWGLQGIPEYSPRSVGMISNGFEHVVHHASVSHVLLDFLPGCGASHPPTFKRLHAFTG